MTKARQKTAAPELRAALAFTGGNNGANQDGPAFARGYSESLREQAGRQAKRGSCAQQSDDRLVQRSGREIFSSCSKRRCRQRSGKQEEGSAKTHGVLSHEKFRAVRQAQQTQTVSDLTA